MGKVTQSVFDAVKTCLKNGNTIAETAKFMKLSQLTVCKINRSENYADYKNMRKTECEKKKAQNAAKKHMAKAKGVQPETVNDVHAEPNVSEQPVKVIHEQSVTIQATHYMMQEQQKTNEFLKLMSNKMSACYDEFQYLRLLPELVKAQHETIELLKKIVSELCAKNTES